MLRIGIVGIGFMGMIHFLAAQRLEGAGRVVAICSRDPKKRAGDWRGIQGNFGPAGTQVDLTGIQPHATLEELLGNPAVDLVDLCLPTSEHVDAVRRCLLAGKHVLVEKPLALRVEDAEELVGLAATQGRQLLVAQVLPFFPQFRFAHDFLRSGEGGAILAAHFHRIISRPDWSASIGDMQASGGPIVDLHIHDTHFVRLLFGMPTAVASIGVHSPSGAIEHAQTQYHFATPLCVAATCGALCMKGRPFTHGFELYFERATLLFSAGTQPLTLLTPDGDCRQLQLPGGDDPVDAFAEELLHAVATVQTGETSHLLAGELARDALRLCRAEEQSIRERRPISLG